MAVPGQACPAVVLIWISRMRARSPGSGAKSAGGAWEHAAKTHSATGATSQLRTILLDALSLSLMASPLED